MSLAALIPSSLAHTADRSYLRVAVSAQAIECSFAFDFSTLGWITAIDANGDRAITPDELEAAAPRIEEFLRGAVGLRLDDRQHALGAFVAAPWPKQGEASVTEDESHRLFAIFRFRSTIESPPERVAVTVGFCPMLGNDHMVLSTFAAGEKEERVVFTERFSTRAFKSHFPSATPLYARP